MRVKLEIELIVEAESVHDAESCVDVVIDEGSFQRAIVASAADVGLDVRVASTVIHTAYQLVPLPEG